MRGYYDGCTRNLVPSIQHNIPITKGGKHELGNISVICKKCNVSIRNNVTGKLNADEVTRVWNGINVSKMETQVRLGKDREGEDSIGESNTSNATATPSLFDANKETVKTDQPQEKKGKKKISPEAEAFRKEPANKELYRAIWTPILERAGTFAKYDREGEAVWQSIDKLMEKIKGLDLDPLDTACNMANTYMRLIDTGQDFWIEVTPTKFYSCFEKIWAEYQRPIMRVGSQRDTGANPYKRKYSLGEK